MEDVMYLPMGWQLESVCDFGYLGGYLEGSVLPWG